MIDLTLLKNLKILLFSLFLLMSSSHILANDDSLLRDEIGLLSSKDHRELLNKLNSLNRYHDLNISINIFKEVNLRDQTLLQEKLTPSTSTNRDQIFIILSHSNQNLTINAYGKYEEKLNEQAVYHLLNLSSASFRDRHFSTGFHLIVNMMAVIFDIPLKDSNSQNIQTDITPEPIEQGAFYKYLKRIEDQIRKYQIKHLALAIFLLILIISPFITLKRRVYSFSND